jgi:hypothetical protein
LIRVDVAAHLDDGRGTWCVGWSHDSFFPFYFAMDGFRSFHIHVSNKIKFSKRFVNWTRGDEKISNFHLAEGEQK